MPGNEVGSIDLRFENRTGSTRWLPPSAPPSAVNKPVAADTALGVLSPPAATLAACADDCLEALGLRPEFGFPAPTCCGSIGCPALARLASAAPNWALPCESVPSMPPITLPTAAAP